MSMQQGGGVAVAPKVTRDERKRIERRNRSLLQRELFAKRFSFESRPYEAHVQFSNFCNMACVMCKPEGNPPLERMPPELLERFGEQVARDLSVITPHGGSEPLTVGWDETRRLAEEYNVLLELTTNVQLLDERRFEELKDITEGLRLSIDSHIPEVFASIRPGSKPEMVFRNLATTARLAREHRLECMVQIVLMTQNAPMLPETIAYMADVGIESINVIPLVDLTGRNSFFDPLLQCSAEYIDWIKQRSLDMAREKRIWFGWLQKEVWDFRDESTRVPIEEGRVRSSMWNHAIEHYLPGYCKQVYERLAIDADGTIKPCCYASDDELDLGNLAEQDFDEIWNSPTARDLRRAHLTWDYPSLCKTCWFTDLLPPAGEMPFMAGLVERIAPGAAGLEDSITVRDPVHMTRQVEPPTFRFEPPENAVGAYHVALSLGGGQMLPKPVEQLEIASLEPVAAADGMLEATLAAEVWERLETNFGYWWTILATCDGEPRRVVRAHETRCLIRHEGLPRIEDSTLRFPDEGALPAADLGGGKGEGWRMERRTARPRLGGRERPPPPRRLTAERAAAKRGQSTTNGSKRLPPREYVSMLRRIRKLVASALPADATVLVASKGHDALLDLEGRNAVHFPCADDGSYIGYNPPDGAWIVDLLERRRGLGAEFLLLPATAAWWLDYYSELSRQLAERYPEIAREEGACVIFDLRPSGD
jgi:radical SAM protein with 4Fe4S-binding SPASM domain